LELCRGVGARDCHLHGDTGDLSTLVKDHGTALLAAGRQCGVGERKWHGELKVGARGAAANEVHVSEVGGGAGIAIGTSDVGAGIVGGVGDVLVGAVDVGLVAAVEAVAVRIVVGDAWVGLTGVGLAVSVDVFTSGARPGDVPWAVADAVVVGVGIAWVGLLDV